MNIIYYNESSVFDELSSNERYLIAIDSDLVSTHQVELPKMNLAKAKKAIPFLLEDTLLDDIENLDFFVRKTANTHYYEVIVMGKQVMSELQEKIEHAQLGVERCVIDFMLLPNDKEKMHYQEDERGILFRFGEFLGGRMDKVIFDESPIDQYQLINATLDIKNSQINLLEVDWLKNWEKSLRQWRVGIVIILLLAVLLPVHLIMDNYYLSEKVQMQRSANQSTFKKLFPEVKRIVDLPVQIKQKVNQANSSKTRSSRDLLTELKLKNKPDAVIKHLKFNQQTLTLKP
ncbi:type II secretion system protein GspL [Bathymodiolus thermophilus thioautotrophic gill symbiont]|jgi:type II secretory pathway component PulL|uniref:GspL cytoplasmic actin-ATPase-like domain-containing protein n=1 Tax=Bathymodiolus thermophilus thioautotrophic gill symbiont TaxID=2360 RepID=A0A1J5UDJ1_9GAMM|nr:type II secretion system protein GspL [Bathymodiolus thermophilus thioautotrophic gill symbiont]AYQ56465.1 hypothetical protein MS2017_0737 [Bathymodiolus thermophilus thioautotrophic gill symbiont]OIR23997.1 hypothetical protein BGC33_08930 [Bathymodiolus thermophilus thioautotrophic gill symbiont]CAB5496140.1 hypothetical protein THERMOS_436 [Bathymodiolus thermophilus thioautotrophic gill symbiont]